ncbi:uncharacterized protein DS421_3g94690 [Arachis hypogaea]|nr:uncharacterized protein DS421_3g94690 [Arachis hypogaea]
MQKQQKPQKTRNQKLARSSDTSGRAKRRNRNSDRRTTFTPRGSAGADVESGRGVAATSGSEIQRRRRGAAVVAVVKSGGGEDPSPSPSSSRNPPSPFAFPSPSPRGAERQRQQRTAAVMKTGGGDEDPSPSSSSSRTPLPSSPFAFPFPFLLYALRRRRRSGERRAAVRRHDFSLLSPLHPLRRRNKFSTSTLATKIIVIPNNKRIQLLIPFGII